VAALRDLVLRETTAIGLRIYPVEKVMLPRQTRAAVTPWGEVRVKECGLPDGGRKAKPEFEDCRRLAEETGVSLSQVMEAARRGSEEYL
jgi:uncharacterized protein (DUF111 family)